MPHVSAGAEIDPHRAGLLVTHQRKSCDHISELGAVELQRDLFDPVGKFEAVGPHREPLAHREPVEREVRRSTGVELDDRCIAVLAGVDSHQRHARLGKRSAD
jgi:hypothetical protein